jgi:hypothetical protein
MNRQRLALFGMIIGLVSVVAVSGQDAKKQTGAPPQPGADLAIYSPKTHDLYDARFVMSAGKVYMVGTLNDKAPWDHIDNDAKNVHPVKGTFEIDVDERKNTGTCTAKLEIPKAGGGSDTLEIAFDEFKEFSPCHDGGIAAFLMEHGDSGCGDTNWPKTLTYVFGWGLGHAKLNGKTLELNGKKIENYQVHFMVTQGMRDRKTLKVNYPMLEKKSKAGEVNPAAVQLDFILRSPQEDKNIGNNPPREVFLHFFAMEVTWK